MDKSATEHDALDEILDNCEDILAFPQAVAVKAPWVAAAPSYCTCTSMHGTGSKAGWRIISPPSPPLSLPRHRITLNSPES